MAMARMAFSTPGPSAAAKAMARISRGKARKIGKPRQDSSTPPQAPARILMSVLRGADGRHQEGDGQGWPRPVHHPGADVPPQAVRPEEVPGRRSSRSASTRSGPCEASSAPARPPGSRDSVLTTMSDSGARDEVSANTAAPRPASLRLATSASGQRSAATPCTILGLCRRTPTHRD
jgi:hypothetical protein